MTVVGRSRGGGQFVLARLGEACTKLSDSGASTDQLNSARSTLYLSRPQTNLVHLPSKVRVNKVRAPATPSVLELISLARDISLGRMVAQFPGPSFAKPGAYGRRSEISSFHGRRCACTDHGVFSSQTLYLHTTASQVEQPNANKPERP